MGNSRGAYRVGVFCAVTAAPVNRYFRNVMQNNRLPTVQDCSRTRVYKAIRRVCSDYARQLFDVMVGFRGLVWGSLHRRPKKVTADARHILVCNLQALGDTTASLKAVRHLQSWVEQRPERAVKFVVRAELSEWIQTRIVGIDVLGVGPGSKSWHSLRQRLANWLPDVAIDMDTTSNTRALELALSLRAPVIISSDLHGKRQWADQVVSMQDWGNDAPPVATRYMRMVQCFYPAAGAEVRKVFKRQRSATTLNIDIHPGASKRGIHRRWPVSEFASLATRIARQWPSRFHFFGALDEAELISDFQDTLPGRNAVMHVGLSLSALAKAFVELDVLLCNNSGPMHVAIEMGTPTVSIRGPSGKCWEPTHHEAFLGLHADLRCIGCEDTSSCVYGHACMTSYSAESAWPCVQSFITRVVTG